MCGVLLAGTIDEETYKFVAVSHHQVIEIGRCSDPELLRLIPLILHPVLLGKFGPPRVTLRLRSHEQAPTMSIVGSLAEI